MGLDGFAGRVERFFRVRERGSSVRREVVAGLTTFMTMAYILFVNPAILGGAGVPKDGVVAATALSAAIATLIMGLYANAPFALAPGMGLNSYFAYTVVPFVAAVLAAKHVTGVAAWQVALGAVLVEGIVFVILSLTRVRESVANSIPPTLKYSIAAGIGLFLTLIGLRDAGLIQPTSFAVSLNVKAFTMPGPMIALLFTLIAGVLMALRVPGAILFSIIGAMIAGYALHVTDPPSTVYSVPHFTAAFKASVRALLDLGVAAATAIVFTFFMVDFFDTLGTVTGLGAMAGLMREDGKVEGIGRMLLTDAIGTVTGALLGTSTVTTYIESAAGVEEGGRTGLTAVVVGLLFLLGLVFTPLLTATPDYATAPALIIVGLLMASAIKRINLDDPTEALPAFLTIAGIPFTFSISDGMALGFISYVFLKAATGRWRELNPILVGVALLFLAYFLSLPHIHAGLTG
ncbi:MAG: NCS2 family permease [Desulfurococcales archaeon]|nr:NCS2 family permease [Desulfurococcales archaeon]